MAILGSQGARVGNYILIRQLGVGGMAEVWLVRDQSNAQLRAMKYLNAQFAGIPEVEARFQAEGEHRLVHPNIVRIYEVGQQDGSSFMAMDFIDGRDLEKIMDSRRGPLRIPEAVDIAIQILSGLGYAHANGIVHRDIKPSNVLVDEDGQAFLMDFGIAKAMRSRRNMTQINTRLGTPDYMSPEQIRSSRDVDARSDIYSFGCLFYELLTGWPPFDTNTGYESVHNIQTAHVTVAPVPPMERRAGLPPELNAVVMHCLEKTKEDRPQTCEEIIATLEAYRATQRASAPVQPRTTPPPVRTQKPEPLPEVKPEPPQAFTQQPPQKQTGGFSDSWNELGGKQGGLASPPWGAEKLARPGTFPNASPAPQPGTTVKSAYGHPLRTPTVTDPPPVSSAVPQPHASGRAGGQDKASTAAGQTASGQVYAKGTETKNRRIPLMVAGIVLVLLAAGGGAWAFLHKDEPQTQVPTSKQDSTPENGNTANSSGQTPSSPEPGKAGTKQVTDSTTKPTLPSPHEPDRKLPQKDRQEASKPLQQATSGTIVWTGTIDNPGQQMVDIYIPRQAATVGSFSIQPRPVEALPISVAVASGNAIVLNQPSPGQNYSTFRIAVRAMGQQTVTLRWSALSSNANPM